VKALLEAFSPRELLCASPAALQAVRGLSALRAEAIRRALRDAHAAAEEQRLADCRGVRILTLLEKEYPGSLRNLVDPPPVLYVRGSLAWDLEPAVAIVGCRGPSPYGLRWAQRLAHDLAQRGITVVSGLALGIDTAAHQGALQAQGRTWAVLGSGLGRLYPEENEALAEAVAATGSLISEFPLLFPPRPGNFPRRNRLVSGLSLGTVVIEAAHRSGALVTARLALEQGREVFALPGDADRSTAQGANQLLREGAHLVSAADDIIDVLGLQPVGMGAPAQAAVLTADLDLDQQRVYESLPEAEALHIDQLAQAATLEVPRLARVLMQLELAGYVRQLPGKWFCRQPSASARVG
jgi:DNA processing protein